MNLFDFSLNYLQKQTLTKIPDFNLSELALYYDTPEIFQPHPVFTIDPQNITKNDMMMYMAASVSGSQNCRIYFYCTFEIIRDVLNDFDPDYVSILNPQSLYEAFYEYYMEEKKRRFYFFNFSEYSWREYSKNLISIAKYLKENYKDYNTYIKDIRSNPQKAVKEIQKIRGFGLYFTYSFLTKIGCYEFWEDLFEEYYDHPDKNIIHVFKTVGFDINNKEDYLTTLKTLSKTYNVYPYNFTKMLDLIFYPRYRYHHKVFKNSPKKNHIEMFLNALEEAYKKGEVTI